MIKLFEAFNNKNILNTIDDILIEVHDIGFTNKQWLEPGITKLNKNRFVLVIETIDKYLEDGLRIEPIISETIKRVIDFMKSEGFHFKIEIGSDDLAPDDNADDYFKDIKYEELDKLTETSLWSNEFIRIDFIK